MTRPGTDPLLARLERNAMLFAALAAVASIALRGGRFDVAFGIAGGALLVFVSYGAIRGGVDTLVDLVAAGAGGDREAAGADNSSTTDNAAEADPKASGTAARTVADEAARGVPPGVPEGSDAGEPEAGEAEADEPPAPSREEVRRRLPRRARPAVAALRFAGRYALLGFLAYVMIARLRLHPVGLLTGVSSVVAAAVIEAVRQLTGADRPQGPRGRPPAS